MIIKSAFGPVNAAVYIVYTLDSAVILNGEARVLSIKAMEKVAQGFTDLSRAETGQV